MIGIVKGQRGERNEKNVLQLLVIVSFGIWLCNGYLCIAHLTKTETHIYVMIQNTKDLIRKMGYQSQFVM